MIVIFKFVQTWEKSCFCEKTAEWGKTYFGNCFWNGGTLVRVAAFFFESPSGVGDGA